MGAVLFALCSFLALYTWNARTGYLDTLAENSGLEVTGYLLLPSTWIKKQITLYWDQYVALVDAAEENARLREEAGRAERHLANVKEDLAELARLRALVGLPPPENWQVLGTRVIAGRFGPAAFLETVMIDRGYATGAPVGTPLITHKGLAGRVYRASPHIATVILITDQTFRIPVMTSEGRVPGVLMGGGPQSPLEVRYVAPNARVDVGETLISSGLDNAFPKGLPVARVTSAEPGTQTLFQQIQAEPLSPPDSMEEALLLIAPPDWPVNAARPDALPAGIPPARPDTPGAAPQVEENTPQTRPQGRIPARTVR